MACLSRIRQTRVTRLFPQLKRSYFLVSAPCLSDSVSQKKLPNSSNRQQILGLLGRSNVAFDNVRFFAAPVQSKKKEETTKSKGPRLNEQIKTQMVRLVSDEGHEIVPIHVALERAKDLNCDLVEVNCNAKPIVCKIMDYHLDRYQQQLKEKERSKNKAPATERYRCELHGKMREAESSVRKGSCKEVRLSLKIEQKDLEMKADMTKRLMERGYRVKCMVLGSPSTEEDPKLRAAIDQKLRGLIDRLHALIEDVAFVESGPRVEKSQAYVVVRHIKFGPSKKGGKGAAKSADAASSGCQKDTTSRSTGGRPSGPIQQPADVDLRASEHSGSENDYDESFSGDSDSKSTPLQHNMQESLSDATGTDERVFDFGDDLKNNDRISDQKKKPVPDSVPPNVDVYPAQMPRVPNYMGSGANSSENRYDRRPHDSTGAGRVAAERLMRPGPDRAEMPQAPSFMGPGSNSFENRYSRRTPGAEQYTQPGPDRATKFMGPGSNSSENRYSRSPPGAERYTPGPDLKSFIPPPRREIPKQNPTTSDCVPPSTNYGIFSNSGTSLPRNCSFGGQMRPPNDGGSPFGFTKTLGPASDQANPDSPPTDCSTENTNVWSGLFSGDGSNAKTSRTFPNLPKVRR